MNNKYPQVIEKLIKNLVKLPGIGEKTAVRLAFFLLNSNNNYVNSLANSIIDLKKKIKLCKICYNFTENEICNICSDIKRDKSIICVVENVSDMFNIEQTGEYKGVYHILHGAFSPINGVTFENMKIKELIDRVRKNKIKEIIIATNPTAEGSATAVYIKNEIDKLKRNIKITRIASGIPVGAELEYIDKLTLTEALKNRIKFK
jgi:recombination protein RecR